MANYIKQLQDANGNNIYPLAYNMGGAKMDLLWTNPDLSSTSGLTVPINLSSYDLIYVQFQSSNADKLVSNLCRIDGKEYIAVTSNVSTSSGNPTVARYRTYTVSSTDVVFGGCYIAGTTSTASGALIPYQIYGIKFSYIVPTTVQGLQYIEV